MVVDVIRFLPDLHHDIRDVFVRLLEPGMVFVQLVIQDESQGFFAVDAFTCPVEMLA